MSGSLTANWYQYSQWVKNIARNSRITNPTDPADVAFLARIKVFLKFIYNPVTQTGTRPWLAPKFNRLAIAAGTGDQYDGNIDMEPVYVLVKMLEVVGRDLKKIPITDAEVAQANTLISLASNRDLGTGPYFGGVVGSR